MEYLIEYTASFWEFPMLFSAYLSYTPRVLHQEPAKEVQNALITSCITHGYIWFQKSQVQEELKKVIRLLRPFFFTIVWQASLFLSG
jgi:hypothetical protein